MTGVVVVERPRASRKVTVWSFVAVLILLVVCIVWLDVPIQSAVVFLLFVLFLFLASFGLTRLRDSQLVDFVMSMLPDPRSVLAQARFGQPVLSISTRQLSVGDHFELAYQQQWKRAAEVDRIVAQLVLRETVQYTSSSSGPNQYSIIVTDRHDKVVQRHTTPGRRFQAGEICGDTYAFQIPPDGMHTFAPTSNNRIEWYVRLAVEVPKRPGLSRMFERFVGPDVPKMWRWLWTGNVNADLAETHAILPTVSTVQRECEITVLPELMRRPPDQPLEQGRYRAIEAKIRSIQDALANWIESDPDLISVAERIKATADVEVRLILQGGEANAGVRRYEPGSTVPGMVQLIAGQDVKCDRVFVRLGWHTEGRGDRDAATVEEVELLRGPLTANTSSTHSFGLTLPDQPCSYAGHYINIIWEVTATLALPFTRDITRTEPIVVAPRHLT